MCRMLKSIGLGLIAWGMIALTIPTAPSFAAPSASVSENGPERTLIDHVHILDGRGGPPAEGRVLVEGGRIAKVLPETGPAPDGTATLDGEGGYLLPGFIDMHAHLMVPRCGEDDAPAPRFDRAVSERMLSTLLDFGITTVRSPATPTIEGLRLRDDLNADRIRGPRAFA